jgi:hypothetical protein
VGTSAVEAVVGAVEAAAGVAYREKARRPEARLVDALEAQFRAPTKREYSRERVEGWVRQPGGVDLALLRPDGRAFALIETKIAKLDESPWDILKLAALRRHPQVEGAFLVYEGPAALFESDSDCAVLFRGTRTRPIHLPTAELVGRWPRAWANLLDGGYGNHPLDAPAGVSLCLRFVARAVRYPEREIRVVEVAALDGLGVTFSGDGWPVGVAPAARDARAVRLSRDERASTRFPRPMRQAWLDERVAALSEREFDALLRELRSRGWSAEELDRRVYPRRPARGS